jgi:hypothetical protein
MSPSHPKRVFRCVQRQGMWSAPDAIDTLTRWLITLAYSFNRSVTSTTLQNTPASYASFFSEKGV